MRKELTYEYKTYPPAEEGFRSLCDRLKIGIREEDLGDALIATTTDRALYARLSTELKARGGLKAVIHIRIYQEEYLDAVLSCLGKPTRERTISPSATNFAEAVVMTEFSGDTDAFIKAVCAQVGIEPKRFGSFRAMILTTANMPGASTVIKNAAQKLRKI